MGDLSKNFSTWEFKCRHCGKVAVAPALSEALQELRNLADVPVRIISGYRCPEHNSNCGGAKRSYHMRGMAADVVIDGKTVYQTLDLVRQVPAFDEGGIGLYERHGFVHCDVRGKPARWGGAT